MLGQPAVNHDGILLVCQNQFFKLIYLIGSPLCVKLYCTLHPPLLVFVCVGCLLVAFE